MYNIRCVIFDISTSYTLSNWDNIYILLHGYFYIDLSMCPVNIYFPLGLWPSGENTFLQATYSGQYKNNHVIIYKYYMPTTH